MKSQALLVLLAASSSLAQGTFQNLDFESARNIPVFDPQGHPWTMSAADALPGWTCYLGTNYTGSAWYNDIALDSAAISIQSSTARYVPPGLLSGEYCLSLQGGRIYLGPDTYYFGASSVAQSGQIPADARSIQFKVWHGIAVTFAGNNIPLAILESQENYNVLGGDISQFAGQTGELRFTSSQTFLDDIEFSPVQIPEPSAFSLFALGGVSLIIGASSARRRIRVTEEQGR